MINRVKYLANPIRSLPFERLCSHFHSPSSTANSLYQLNSQITSHFRIGDIESALCLFNEMPVKNLVTWNCMISGYIRNGMVCEARQLFDEMPVKNIVTWTAMLNGYAKFGSLDEARSFFDAITHKNVVCWNSLLSGYTKSGRYIEARQLFDEMPIKNHVSWATMIEACFCQGLVEKAEDLFNACPRKDTFVCNAMLAGYAEMGNLESLSKLFARMRNRDKASWTNVISCFARFGEIEKARALFDEMPTKDIVVWTVMIRGYLQNGQIEGAQKLFNIMPGQDIVAWNSMIRGYVQDGRLEEAIELFKEMPRRNIVSWNTILQGYVEQNDMLGARNFFDNIPKKDQTSWNIMISGSQSDEALGFYIQTLRDGIKPNHVSFTSMISICGSLAIHGWGKAMHSCVIKYAYENDTVIVGSLISMYSRCGFMADATMVFERMIYKDTVAWNTMIVAHAYHSSAIEALKLFTLMTQSGNKPDHVTFLGLLTACAHSGVVDESWKYFKSMEKDWNLIPKAEHYSCMVDIFGKSGLLDEAYGLVKQLPVSLPAYTWESLLSSCRVHENFELGKLVIQKLSSVQPLNIGVWVLQSNIYAARGMWEDAANVRAVLKRCGGKKELACSWIEMKGQIFQFVYNDKSHVWVEDIYKELESLSAVIEEFK